MRTVHDVFPTVMVWETLIGRDYLLIGFPDAVAVDEQTLVGRLQSDSPAIFQAKQALVAGYLPEVRCPGVGRSPRECLDFESIPT